MRDFGVGLYKGVTGVVTQPIKGARKEGALGALKGIGKGVAGLVLKPAIGTIDFVVQTAEGIKNTTTLLDDNVKARIRPPRHFGSDSLLRCYHNQFYVYHVTLPNEEIIIMSESHVFVGWRTLGG